MGQVCWAGLAISFESQEPLSMANVTESLGDCRKSVLTRQVEPDAAWCQWESAPHLATVSSVRFARLFLTAKTRLSDKIAI